MKKKLNIVITSISVNQDSPYWGLGDQLRGLISAYNCSYKLGIETRIIFLDESYLDNNKPDAKRIRFIHFQDRSHLNEFLRSFEGEIFLCTNGFGEWDKCNNEEISISIRCFIDGLIDKYSTCKIPSKIENVIHVRLKDDFSNELDKMPSKLISFLKKYDVLNENTIVISNYESAKQSVTNNSLSGEGAGYSHFAESDKNSLSNLFTDIKCCLKANRVYSYSDYDWPSGLIKSLEILYGINVTYIGCANNLFIKKVKKPISDFSFFIKGSLYKIKEYIRTYKYLIPLKIHSNRPIKFITAADSSHFKSLIQLLKSISKYEKKSEAVIYDLGFEPWQSKKIIDNFPNYTLKKFDYDKYPDYFNIKINAGEYAWKPAIVYTELNLARDFENLVWTDAGNKLVSKLEIIKKILNKEGFYFTRSAGRLVDWTHPTSLIKYNIYNTQVVFNYNVNAAFFGLNKNSFTTKLISDWFDCACIKNCIAPSGSSRENHRQDQAILSCLISISKNYKTFRQVQYKTHCDID